jgi:protease secretion system outer membrane protein
MRRTIVARVARWASVTVVCVPALATELPAALEAAQARDPALASARANRDAAAENVALAQARLLPQLSLQASAAGLAQQTTQDTALGPRTTDFTGPAGSLQLSLRQGLYRPRDQVGVDIGERQAELGQHRLSLTASDVGLRAVTAWLDVLSIEAQRRVLADAAAAAHRLRDQARAKLEAGDGTRDALAEATAQAAQADARVREAEAVLEGRQRVFTLLTGLSPVDLARRQLPDGAIPELPWADDTTLGDYLAERNAQLRAALVTRAIGEGRLAQARADYRPVLDLVASASQSRNDGGADVGSRYQTLQIGVQFSVPLYTGGSLSAAERQALAQAIAAQGDLEAATQELRRRVSQQWAELRGRVERIAAAGELVSAAREQLRAAEQGLRNGVRSVSDVSSAVVLLANRKLELIDLQRALLLTQGQIVAQLPIDDPVWRAWVTRLDGLAAGQ